MDEDNHDFQSSEPTIESIESTARFNEHDEHARTQADVSRSDEPPHREHKQRRFGLVIAFLCVALISGAFGSAGTYLLMNHNLKNAVDQAVMEAVNSFSLQPQTGNTVSYTTSDMSGVIEQMSEGVVSIVAEGQTTYFGRDSIATSAGSGVIIRSDGIIVTCDHVIAATDTVYVYLKNGQEYEAQVIGSDEKSDLAVLKIDANNLSAIAIGDSTAVHLGESVIAIGNPLGELNGSVTVGVISAIDRNILIGDYNMTVLQTDAAINPGNSGGALLNTQGQLIGVVNAKSVGMNVEGLGFAIPMHKATSIIEQLLNYGYVKDRPYIGISMQGITSSRMGDEPGVYIVQVYSDTAADLAGLQIGDRIVSVDGHEIKSISDMDTLINAFVVGQTITMVVDRDGQQITCTLTLQDSSNRQS